MSKITVRMKLRKKKGNASIEASMEDVTPSTSNIDKEKNKKQKKKKTIQLAPEIESKIELFVKGCCSASIVQLKAEYTRLSMVVPQPVECYNGQDFREKSRFPDSVPCLEKTRVLLQKDSPDSSDFIHANKITIANAERNYIATQVPLPGTFEDFWKMVYQQEVCAIVVLGEVSTVFFPKESGEHINHGNMWVNNRKAERKDYGMTAMIEVLPEGCSESRILPIQYGIAWSNLEAPNSPRQLVCACRNIRTCAEGPVLVMCDSGAGRAGTFIAFDVGICYLNKGLPIQVPLLCNEIRSQRAGAVRFLPQYLFIYRAICDYISAKLPKYREQLEPFEDILKRVQK